jgi:hypothetical protein
LAVGLVVLVVACGGTQTATSSMSSSPSQVQFSPGPAQLGHLPVATSSRLTTPPQVTCNGDVGNSDPVAVVIIHGQSREVLRDYADESHPRTFCSFGDGISVTAILDPHHVLMNSGMATAVLELPSGRAFELAVNGSVVGVAPDLSQVLWFSYTDPPALQDSWDSGGKVIQVYPPQIGGRCSGLPTGAFSRDSNYAFAIWNDGPNATFLTVVGNHTGVYFVAPPAAGWAFPQAPMMGLWSPVADKLYYAQQGGIRTWTPTSGGSELKAGLTWTYPAMSPDGNHIAYVDMGADYSAWTVHLMDPATGADQGRIGGGQRALPMFLSNNLIWLRNEGQGCGPTQPASYIYDLRDKTETASSLDWVFTTWPATSALGG